MKQVIIGASIAGLSAAKKIRQSNPKDEIIVISSDSYIYSRCMLHLFIDGQRDLESLSFVEDNFFEKYHITWKKTTTVQEIDCQMKQITLDNGEIISYDNCLLATGAKSFIPPIGDLDKTINVFGLRNLDDAINIQKYASTHQKFVIIGSGLIGMDVAYALLKMKKDVTVIEIAPTILPIQLNEQAAQNYQDLFEKAGCKFICGAKILSAQMNQEKKISQIVLANSKTIICDCIICATGVRANIPHIKDEKLKIDRFVVVDNFLKTNIDHLYAAGDINGIAGIWPNAKKQGDIAGLNMTNANVEYFDHYPFKNTINFFDLPTLAIGKNIVEEGDTIIEENDQKGYRRAIIKNGILKSIILQGNIDYSGIYLTIIKNKIVLDHQLIQNIFHLSFADFFSIDQDGQYIWTNK